MSFAAGQKKQLSGRPGASGCIQLHFTSPSSIHTSSTNPIYWLLSYIHAMQYMKVRWFKNLNRLSRLNPCEVICRSKMICSPIRLAAIKVGLSG